MNTPVMLDDVLIGEAVWGASKSLLSGSAVLLVASALGLCQSLLALWVLPIMFITGLAFASLGLIVTAVSPSYDFFMYYFTLFITPMMLLCGVFFPAGELPPTQVRCFRCSRGSVVQPHEQYGAAGRVDSRAGVLAYAAAVYAALVLTRRRLLQ